MPRGGVTPVGAFLALSGSRFSRAMNWALAAAGVAYAAWLTLAGWPSPGWPAAVAWAGAGLGVWLAAVDVHALAMRAMGRLLLGRARKRTGN